MSSPTGIVAPPTLNGEHLTAATAQPEVRWREMKTIRETGTGARREFLVFEDYGYPVRKKKREFLFRYQHMRAAHDLVEDLLAGPGPHTLCDWKAAHLAWAGTGSRSEFFLPWPVANHTLTPPSGQPSSRFDPVVRVGMSGTVLTYLKKTQAQYDAGAPAAGEVWFLDGGTKFKLETAPTATEVVYGWIVPLYTVLEAPQGDKRYQGPIREPRDLLLLEA